MKKTLSVILIAALVLSLCACGSFELEPVMAEPSPAPEPTSVSTPEPAPEPTPETTPEPTSEPTPEPEAVEVAMYSDHERSAQLFDSDYISSVRFDAGEELTICSDSPFSSLYLIWETMPGSYTLHYDGGELECGASGFLHEYIQLPHAVSEVTVVFPDEEVYLSDIYAFTDGTLPDWVQTWLPPCETADILLFPTHADDEYLFFGGIIPYYGCELGLDVQVVYMTCHYFGCEKFRCHEQLNGLWAAGIKNYPVINLQEDTAVESYEEAALHYGTRIFTAFEVEQIRRFKPLVIVGHDLNGEYGNAAHQLNARCLTDAVEYAADPEQFPESAEEYGTWDTPKMYLHLYGDDPISLNWETPLESFAGMTAFECAQYAYTFHLSQQHWAFHVYDYDEEFDCHSFGLYRTTVGEDVSRNDFMENTEGIR